MSKFLLFLQLVILVQLGTLWHDYGFKLFAVVLAILLFGTLRGALKAEQQMNERMHTCERCQRKFHGAMVERCQFEGCVHDAGALNRLSEQLTVALRLANERATAPRPTAAQLRATRPRRVIRGLSPSPTVEPAHASPNTDKAPTTEDLPRAFYDGS